MRNIDQATLHAIPALIALPWMEIEDGKRYAKLVNRRTGEFAALAGSSSDHRAAQNANAGRRSSSFLNRMRLHFRKNWVKTRLNKIIAYLRRVVTYAAMSEVQIF